MMRRFTVVLTMLMVLLLVVAVQAEMVTVKSDRAYVRKEYKPKADVLFTVLKNFPLKILKTYGGWFYVEDFEGDKGWIYGKTVTKNVKCCVIRNNDFGNIRSGASSKDKVIYRADYGVAFEIIKTKGDWFNVKHANGKTGWVHKSLLWGNF
jgi:SH3-like domain-containing protein